MRILSPLALGEDDSVHVLALFVQLLGATGMKSNAGRFETLGEILCKLK